MQYVMLVIVVGGLAFIYGQIWFRRRRVAPLRDQIRARGITFRAVLDRVDVLEPGSLGGDSGGPISRPVELIIRGDAFEVSSAIPLGRVVMGLEYFFMARATSIELNRLIPRIYGTDTRPRIIVRSWQDGKKIQLTVTQKRDPLDIWNALTAAGAVPGITWPEHPPG
jgi:hypothetical protein